MRYVITSTLLLLCAATSVRAQVATVIDEAIEVEYKSTGNCTTHHRLTMQINNDRGAELASFNCGCDDNKSLSAFSGQILYPSTGKTLKVKKSELLRTEYSRDMASDSYYYYYSPTPATYPYQITYEWTENENGAIFLLPPFVPQPMIGVDVKHSSYAVTYAPDVKMHYTASNMPAEVKEKTLPDGRQCLSVEVNDLTEIKNELFLPSLYDVVPMAYFIPDKFKVNGIDGSMASWGSYGQWLYGLQLDRMILPQALKDKLHAMTDGCTDAYQKLLHVYRLLEETTRYVSIQLGIGGWQPAPASEVFTRGFGDCKGLSNYAVAMLREIGISADYAVIGMKKPKRLPDDVANVAMLNHAIVRVNMPEGPLWMECTDPKLPLGYVHKAIAGHDAVILTPDGGVKVALPEYEATANNDSINLQVVVNEDGTATIQGYEEERNACFENVMGLVELKSDEQRKAIRGVLSLPDFTFKSHEIKQMTRDDRIDNERLPIIVTKFDGDCRKFANTTGSRMFINLFPVSLLSKVTPTQTRSNPVQLCQYNRSFTQHVEIAIPEGRKVEFLPKPVTESTAFGSLEFDCSQQDGKIVTNIHVTLSANIYSADKYQEACKFINRQAELMNSKIVLVK